jgi:hypothetical protein
MDSFDEKMLTPGQLCDALEIHLGREKGQKKCRELLEKMKENPEWKAQLNTLGCTVKVFQKSEGKDVPEGVAYRLKQVLKLDDQEGVCNNVEE